jgi:catechol 2,3-dioxygenase-like lactoylglutathione lyase family enzyme
MQLNRVFEACLYAKDLSEARRFYSEVLRLPVALQSRRLVAFRCGPGVLIVFDPVESRAPGLPGHGSPSHGAEGPGHAAFAIDPSEIEPWRLHLQASGVAIETEVAWPSGAHSIYFRDPAGNSVELVTPFLWGFDRNGEWAVDR